MAFTHNTFEQICGQVAASFKESLGATVPKLNMSAIMMYPDATKEAIGINLGVRLLAYEPPAGFTVNYSKFMGCTVYKGTIEGKKVALKVFENASMHVTGINSEPVLDAVKNLFPGHVGQVAGVPDMKVDRFSIQLLSANFKIDKHVRLPVLSELLVNGEVDHGADCRVEVYMPPNNPSKRRHHGLKIFFKHNEEVTGKVRRKDVKATAFVYRTGKIMVTASTFRDLCEAYGVTLALLDTHKHAVCYEEAVPEPRQSASRKRKADMFEELAKRINVA